jgi:hypothetical protein
MECQEKEVPVDKSIVQYGDMSQVQNFTPALAPWWIVCTSIVMYCEDIFCPETRCVREVTEDVPQITSGESIQSLECFINFSVTGEIVEESNRAFSIGA